MAATEVKAEVFGFSETTALLRVLIQRTTKLPDLAVVHNTGQLSQEAYRRLLARLEIPMDLEAEATLLGCFMRGESYPLGSNITPLTPARRYMWDAVAKCAAPIKAVLSFTYSDDFRGFENFFMQWLIDLGKSQSVQPPPNLLESMVEGEEVHDIIKFLHRHRCANILYRLCQLEPSLCVE